MSAQRELNPLFRPGKAAGCRYIMGACVTTKLSNSKEHRAGLEPASPHYGCGVLAARRPVLVVSRTGPIRILRIGARLEPSPARLRAGNAAANTLILCIQLARWELNPRPASYKDAALTAEL